jgi:transglutaminase-like putative cysteine protease
MHIRYGFDIDVSCAQELPIIALLDVHPEMRPDITVEQPFSAVGNADAGIALPVETYVDRFGNICRRFTAPAGGARLTCQGILHHHGFPEEMPIDQAARDPSQLPADTLQFLLPSRYCETEKLLSFAWNLFGAVKPGSEQVQAVCDYVNAGVRFGYNHARATRTAAEVFDERVGVCRDFAHLAITFCRALNIPARYCTGYLGDIGVPLEPYPMDFSAWFEAYIGDRWWTFDARHNKPRIGRILIARGADAADVPILHAFGAHRLNRFEVITDEVLGDRFPVNSADRRDHSNRLTTLKAG